MSPSWKKKIIFLLSLAIFSSIWFSPPPPELSTAGWKTLAVIILAAIFWVTEVIPPAYTSLLIIFIFLACSIGSPAATFTLWVTSLGWFIVSVFLLVGAINKSGIAEKIVSSLLGNGSLSFPRLVCLIYLSQAVLTFIIPHPFPRNLLLMACLYGVLEQNRISATDAAKIGFIVFSSGPPISTIILTGDSVLNPTTVALSGTSLSWFGWLKYMGVPAVAASLVSFFIHLKFFRTDSCIKVGGKRLDSQRLNTEEKVVIFWLAVAMVGWITDFIHGLEPGWIALGAAIGLSLPIPRPVLNLKDINRHVNWPLLLFITGAIAIGSVSRETGLARWLAETLLPKAAIPNDFLVGLMVGGLSAAVHMIVSSVLAAISVATTPLIDFASRAAGWDPLATAMVCNTAANLLYFLPFQNAAVLLGTGKVGFFTQRETIRYGIFMTAGIFIIILAEIAWWKAIGLL